MCRAKIQRVAAVVLLLACPVMSVHASGYWRITGSTASLTLDMIDAPAPDVKSMLLIAYRPDSGCKPEIAVTVGRGLKLGKLISQGIAPSDMTISVDGRSWSGRTFATQYAFAQERGFWAPQALIDTISKGRIVWAKVGVGLPTIEFPVLGAGDAIAAAKRNCLSR